MDKFHAKNRCSPYAARLYKRSKPLNTKNAFFAAQNRSGKMAPKVANNATDACPVTSVSAAEKLNPNTLWQRYSEGKQSAAQLAAQYGCSLKTIRRHLAKAATQADCTLPQAPVNLIMDTTYFGRKWGVMVLYDARSKRALTVTAIERETNALYTQAVAALREKGVVIQSIICDGKSGLLGSFPDIPVQMCQFRQIKIIVRHLTRKPKSPAAQALRALSLTLAETTQAAFEAALKCWYEQYAAFLNEPV